MTYAIRALLRDWGLSLVCVLTLGLGVGATTAAFSLVSAVLLRPLPYPDANRLYLGRTIAPAMAQAGPDVPVNARHVYEWKMRCGSCEEVALVGGLSLTLTDGGEPERLPGLEISANFFRTLGIQPRIGRDMTPAEEVSDRAPVVVIADSLWRRRFGADPAIIGRQLTLDGRPHEVIGVLPKDLFLPKGDQWGALFTQPLQPVIFRPIGFDMSQRRPMGGFNFSSVVRVKRGVPPERALAELNAALAPFGRQFKIDLRAALIPMAARITGDARASLWTLLGAAGILLLVVCVNVGNLMLVRSSGRRLDSAIRFALGARGFDLFRLVLNQSLVLGAAGGVVGAFVAYAAIRWFQLAAPIELPRAQEIGVDWRLFVFAAVLAVVSGAACALFPTWQLGSDPNDVLKSGSTNASGNVRSRSVLVAIEVALSAALMLVGALFVGSLIRLLGVDKGFVAQYIVTQEVTAASKRYTPDVRIRFIDEALRGMRELPGVVSVGVTNQLPLRGETWLDALVDPAKPTSIAEAPSTNFRFVSRDYWKTMGIELKQGRLFEEADRNRHVAAVSDQTAQRMWPNENAIGKRLRRGGPDQPTMEVVGVVANVRASLEKEPPLTMYEPYWDSAFSSISFVLRTAQEPGIVSSEVRRIISSLDPELPLSQTRTMEAVLAESVAVRKFKTIVAAGFALSALLVTSLAIYGLVAFSVARRTKEMGIRIALGEQRSRIAMLVVREGMRPVIAGLVLGIASGLVAARLIASQLFGVKPYDPWSIGTVAVVLAMVGLAACWFPARRAARAEPVRALRFE